MSIESAAANILKRGVDLDTKKRYTEALVCYQEGLQILVDKIKDVPHEETKLYLRKKVEEYMNRAEIIKKIVSQQKEQSHFHEQVQIKDNSSGHSYKTLFGRFLDENVEYVIVEEPYIRNPHQYHNFLHLCELLVKSCNSLRHIELLTCQHTKSEVAQANFFQSILCDLKDRYNVELIIKYSDTLHDRQIILSSGWIIKIGRGLNYFKGLNDKFCLGMHDQDLRLCYETTVDILHSKNIKKSYG